jgi:hypothetical protein
VGSSSVFIGLAITMAFSKLLSCGWQAICTSCFLLKTTLFPKVHARRWMSELCSWTLYSMSPGTACTAQTLHSPSYFTGLRTLICLLFEVNFLEAGGGQRGQVSRKAPKAERV